MSWLEAHGETLPEKTDCEVDLDSNDPKHAKICPECGRILIKYKVGHGLRFFLDHCPGCGGVWLDNNEWEALLEKNLHDEIHKIFSSHWQSGVRENEMRKKFGQVYATRFGEDAYEKVKAFRDWLDTQDTRPEILAYLQAGDPYKL
ncbi:MAG: zf-TFIIB domain-containing protein, partial [Verrucomicrobia bacterium]|nr:zf-TFIIB domain-containing protein [Verrucomicrobiota bacterium]